MKQTTMMLGLRPSQMAVLGLLFFVMVVTTLVVYGLLEGANRRLVLSQVDLAAGMISSTIDQEFQRQETILRTNVEAWQRDSSHTQEGLVRQLSDLHRMPRFSDIALVNLNAPTKSTLISSIGAVPIPPGHVLGNDSVWSGLTKLPTGRDELWLPPAEGGEDDRLLLFVRVDDDQFAGTVVPVRELLQSLHPNLCPEGFLGRVKSGDQTFYEFGETGLTAHSDEIRQRLESGAAEYPIEVVLSATNRYAASMRNPVNRVVLGGGVVLSVLVSAILAVWLRAIERGERLQRRQRYLYNRAPVLYHTLDEKFRIADVNRTECDALGFEPPDLIGKPISELVGLDTELEKELRTRRKGGEILKANIEYRGKAGRRVDVDVTATSVEDEDGRLRWLMAARDVTDIRISQREQLMSYKHVQFLSEVVVTLDEGVLALDDVGTILYANPTASKFLGLQSEELINRKLPDVIGLSERTILWDDILRSAGRGEAWNAEFQFTHPDVGNVHLGFRLGGTTESPNGGRAIILLLQNITTNRQLTNLLAASERRYHMLFDQAPFSMLVLDEAGHIIDGNGTFRRGVSRVLDWYQGARTRMSVFTHPALIGAGVHREFEKLFVGSRLELNQVHFSPMPGKPGAVLSIIGVPEVDADGKVQGAFLFIEDITERLRMEQEREARTLDLEGEKKRAQESNRLKSQFIATISHELRTPLNAIIGFSRIIARKSVNVLDERQMQNLEKIQECGESLLRLINDLLDMSRMEAGRFEVHFEPVPLAQLFDSLRAQVEPLMEKNANQLQMDVPRDVGVVETDPMRLQQILFNLIGNAAKFTRDGRVFVTAEIHVEQGPEEEDPPLEFVDIAVQDTGIGIPQEKLSEIFDEFTQVDGTSTRRFGGTGLGLAISRRLARMLGGEIQVESQVGVGSTFTVRLPRLRTRARATELA